MFWLNTLLRSESEINYETQYLLGVEAEVIAGPLKGLKGKVIKNKSAFRVVLWIDIIMQGVSVEIDPTYLSLWNEGKDHSRIVNEEKIVSIN